MVSVWFDGFDEDLTVLVAQRHWFEWLQLDDHAAVIDEASLVIAAAITEHITPGPRRTATAHLPDGRRIATTPPPPQRGCSPSGGG